MKYDNNREISAKLTSKSKQREHGQRKIRVWLGEKLQCPIALLGEKKEIETTSSAVIEPSIHY